MQWGTIAFVDILGFKGIWRDVSSADLSESLDRVRGVLNQLVQSFPPDGGDLWSQLRIDTRLFSDTIVICSALPDGRDDLRDSPGYEATRRYMLLRYVVLLLTRFVTSAVRGKVPFRYRGCVATGEFDGNDFALFGPAVDEAGELFEAAEGAFVFLAPSAAAAYRARPGLLSWAAFPYFVSYEIPLKGDRTLNTFALNPLLFAPVASRAELRSKILEGFEPAASLSQEVALKRDNTRQFLDLLEESWLP